MAVLCGRDAAAAAAAAAEAGLAVGRDGLEAAADPRRRRRWSTSARRATRTPRSPSPRWTRASTCCARSRWPTRWRRRARWSPRPSGPGRPGCAAWSGSTTGGCPRWRWPGGWWPTGGSGRSGTCARSTCRTGSSTRSSRWCGGCRRRRPGSGALGDIGAHIVDMAQFVIDDRLAGVSALTETFVKERPLPAAASGLSASGGTGARPGHRRRRGAVPRPLRRRGGGELRGHPVRHRTQERDPAGGQRQRGVAGLRLRVDERAVVLRRRRGPRKRRASAASWSPSRPTRTRAPGGRRGTCSGTSTRSPTRWWT